MGAAGRERRLRRRGASALAAAGVLTAGLVAATSVIAENTTGLTTLDQRIVPASNAAGFRQLTLGAPDAGYAVRNGGFGAPGAGREDNRTSIAYFGQLSDFQLADEESPARVEMLDPSGSPFESAHRPWEAMEAQIDDAMIRQMNEFSGAGEAPVEDGNNVAPAMDFSINTGDSADSQQFNETGWVNTLIEGGPINPGTGIDLPMGYTNPFCGAGNQPANGEAPGYTGVQDYDDYDEGQVSPPGGAANDPYFYDPDTPASALLHSDWPQWTGLMDRAQAPFVAEGLDAPHYASFGNHDALLQGSLGGNALLEQVATGCLKPLTSTVNGKNILLSSGSLTPADVLTQRTNNPNSMMVVPPDPDRRFVSKEQYKDIFKAGGEDTGHGFAAVDPAQESGSAGNAGYYSLTDSNSDVPDGLRMIALDTVAEGGDLTSSEGNIDDPQFRWLQGELQEARDEGELVVLYSHHAPASMNMVTTDEAAGTCPGDDSHGHDQTISCDIDPRVSTPLHVGPNAPNSPNAQKDLISTLHEYPNVVAWVAGHSHVNRVEAMDSGEGHGFWVVRVAAEADWPQQARLIQMFDNEDGTLSIFGTIIDHESEATAPAAGSAAAFTASDLASAGRTIAYNDHQSGERECGGDGCGAGTVNDRNVELLVNDPRLLPAEPPAPVLSSVQPGASADTTTPRVVGTAELNSTVTVYSTANCTGPVAGTGSAATFASPGVTATVADGASVNFSATATDAFGNVSDCSNSLPFQEIATPAVQNPVPVTPTPPAKKKSCPKGKKLKKGKCVKKGRKKGKKRK